MALQLHRVVQNATDSDQRGVDGAVDEEMPRPLDNAVGSPRTLTAAVKMPAADVAPEFRPSETAWANRVGGDIDQRGDDQPFVAAASHTAELAL